MQLDVYWVFSFVNEATSPDYEELLLNFLKTKVAVKHYTEWTIGSVKIEDIHQVKLTKNNTFCIKLY